MAEDGNPHAQYLLGKLCRNGPLLIPATKQALNWFTRAAESGNPYAQYVLGKLYLKGEDVPKDEEAAVYWLTESAGQGNDYARHLLDLPNQSPSVLLSVTYLLYHIGSIFRDNAPLRPGPGTMSVDRKLRRKIQEQKIAMGHKPDNHEDHQVPTMTM